MSEYLFLRRPDYDHPPEGQWFPDEAAAQKAYREGRDFRSQGGFAVVAEVTAESWRVVRGMRQTEGRVDDETLRALVELEIARRKDEVSG